MNPRDRLRQQRLRTAELLTANDQGSKITAEVNVTGLAGFLLAKSAAAYGRHKAKDYYDIAFVLLHHNEVFDEAGPLDPADVVVQRLGAPSNCVRPSRTCGQLLRRPRPGRRGLRRKQLLINKPRIDPKTAATDARPPSRPLQERCWAPSLDDQPGALWTTDGVDRCIPAV